MWLHLLFQSSQIIVCICIDMSMLCPCMCLCQRFIDFVWGLLTVCNLTTKSSWEWKRRYFCIIAMVSSFFVIVFIELVGFFLIYFVTHGCHSIYSTKYILKADAIFYCIDSFMLDFILVYIFWQYMKTLVKIFFHHYVKEHFWNMILQTLGPGLSAVLLSRCRHSRPSKCNQTVMINLI
jgi:hypothetical protein